jgi:hypothetical protein
MHVRGTGFFAAPGQIVTCAHVVAGLGNGVDVRWNKITFRGAVEKIGNPKSLLESGPADSPDPDLALIRLEPAAFGLPVTPPCVLLADEKPKLRDPLYSFGHAAGEYAENGEGVLLTYEAAANDKLNREMLKLREGNVNSGMSGSPVLNLRTGNVCGVLFVTRDSRTDLGGRAIPTELVFGMFPDLRAAHDSFHPVDRRWLELWSGWESQQPPMLPAKARSAQSLPKWFIREEASFHVAAEEFRIEKRPNLFGNSTISYKVIGLRSTSDLRGMRWCTHSLVGMVGPPEPDAESKDLIDWDADSKRREQALDLPAALKEIHQIEGAFRFKKKLDAGERLTFGWNLEILNQYALSDWEFENLYAQATHFDGTPLVKPMEYFPHVVWFPVERLRICLSLPPDLRAEPVLRVSQHQGQIPPPQVLHDELVEAWPSLGLPGSKWKFDPVETKNKSAALRPDPARPSSWELLVAAPRVGMAYSLEWQLPRTFTMLVRGAEKIRRKLLEHRSERQSPGPNSATADAIHQAFREFAEDVRQKYNTPESGENFEVTLMTYDSDQRALVVADGLINGGELRETDWKFSVPFGLGLAGACFREGNQVILWVRKERQGRFNPYLSVAEKDQHEVLLIIPIDHPGLREVGWRENPGGLSQRTQQLLGVITVGSDVADTALARLSNSAGAAPDSAKVEDSMTGLTELVKKAGQLGCEIARKYQLWTDETNV